jgi:hypothetical protein
MRSEACTNIGSSYTGGTAAEEGAAGAGIYSLYKRA